MKIYKEYDSHSSFPQLNIFLMIILTQLLTNDAEWLFQLYWYVSIK